jgi:sugar/nucleoside kinase (ribokinase family)
MEVAMPTMLSVGEALVEVMRPRPDLPLDRPAPFVGPFPSGAPAIFADCAARLGADCGFIGVVGDDDFGACLRDRLMVDGVDITHLATDIDRLTGIAFVTYHSDGGRHFLFHMRDAAAGQLGPQHLDREYVAQAQWLHICGSSLAASARSRQACTQAVAWVKNSGGRVSLDPNLRPELLDVEEIRAICRPILEVADVVLPSGEEASMLTGLDNPEEAAMSLVGDRRIVALKRGDKGSIVFTPLERIAVPAFRVAEVDATGAGDCYGAAFLVGLLEGWPLTKVALFANAVGALATRSLGPMEGTPTRQEVEAFLRERPRCCE